MGFIRETIFANYFGLSSEFDLYLIGAVLPVTLNTIILYIAQNYFIPNYHKNRSKDYVISNFLLFFIIFLIAGVLLALFSSSIIKLYIPNLSNEKLAITSTIFRIFILTLPFNGGIAVLSAYLQAEFKFAHPAFSQLILNAGIIVLVVLFYNKFDIWSIPLGYLGGTIIQFIYLLHFSKLKIKFNSIKQFDKFKSIIPSNAFILIILTESISQLYLICDRYFYSSVDRGGIAALNYAMIIYILPISIISYAISTVIFPRISFFSSEKRMHDIQNALQMYLATSIYIFIPISFILYLWGDTFILLFFQRGKFNYLDTIMTFSILKIYCISLLFYSCYSIINKVIYSLGLIRQLLFLTIMGIIIKVTLNIFLVNIDKQNGLALSTTITYIYFFLGGYLLVRYRMKASEGYYFIKELFINILNGIICYVTVQILQSTFRSNIVAIICVILFTTFFFLNSIIVKQKQFQYLRHVINIPGTK
jgi:putative peptidoglycan lipid II flippase